MNNKFIAIGLLSLALLPAISPVQAMWGDSGFTVASSTPKTEGISEFVTPSGIKSEEVESKTDEFMSKFINKNISGVQISVTKNGGIVFTKGYGLADRERNLPVNTKSTFNYASISKMFIWVSAMQLAEQGKLDLNKDIREYLPKNYPLNINSKEPVTFLNLMNHNAGFEAYWQYHDGSGESRDFSSLEEAVHRCYSGIQCFEPNDVQAYSNYGSNLAGLIIEKISGIPYFEYVEKNIFKPCGMQTCYPERKPIEEVMQNKAVGYEFKNDKWGITPVYSGDWLYASGSVVGTADDLSKFALALMPKSGEKSPLFKSNETLKQMLGISYTPSGEELFSVHHGFWGTDGNYRGIGHTGYVEGMVSHFLIVPEESFSVSVLVNDESGWDIAFGATWLLTGTDYTEVDDKSRFPSAKLFEGEYVNSRTQFANRKNPFEITEIKSIDTNTLEVKVGELAQIYKQIRPYLFENITAKDGIKFKSKIYFQVKDSKVIKGVTFKNDLVSVSKLAKFKEAK